ncbi:hypothetical protein PACTADRAFT_48141 [Pachysolen tannophilus NRRL Y-2460]|uniref:Metal-dependent protein hydrolase n=1 Tax=Pachysolen tannophilus NRRL Y-2460 TaxID=669874 RepID=A0A1E4U2Z4_PACTA|nr:hypothetical protein PACTADRAFT_48141 [Pachysolen tannophilus NRRL Y-2460]
MASEEPDLKKQKLDNSVNVSNGSMLKICTHSGTFHADEALGVFLLKTLPKFKNSILVRSRDPKVWEESDIVIDVGGKYDGIKFFDHHQRDFEGTFSSKYLTKLSSAGLVYKHFGKEIIKQVLEYNDSENSKEIELLYEKLYKDFIEAVDANDNGISNYPKDIKPNFNDKNFTLAAVVANLNPSWIEDPTDEDFDKAFIKASELMGSVFINLLNGYGKGWIPARKFVEDAFKRRFETDKSGKILIFDRFVPWKEHLFQIEYENNSKGEILYVLFPDTNQNWRIAAVPINTASFDNRKKLPEPWRGLRDEELSAKTKVEGCVFIHAAGFIGGAKTEASALQLAKLAVAWK